MHKLGQIYRIKHGEKLKNAKIAFIHELIVSKTLKTIQIKDTVRAYESVDEDVLMKLIDKESLTP